MCHSLIGLPASHGVAWCACGRSGALMIAAAGVEALI